MPVGCVVAMTAKDKLRQVVEELSELEAQQALALISAQRDQDPVVALFEQAPEDDEAFSPDEDASADAAWSQYQDGESVSLDELRNEPA